VIRRVAELQGWTVPGWLADASAAQSP
jgi:hypothetical protein